MKKYQPLLYILAVLIVLMGSCDFQHQNTGLFKKLPEDDTGISFSNDIRENDTINVLDYYYCYNGGGVATGDFNNDHLPDVFFTGNMVSSRLYLNKGSLQFDDITSAAGVATHDWIMGVSVVDINADGWLDLYLSVAGPGHTNHYRNLLFVNQGADKQGIPSFTEEASGYGLADTSYSIQSAFLDYDRDGDLDMFLLTNQVNRVDKTVVYPKSLAVTQGMTKDHLYKNIGVSDSLGHPFYVDVSEEAGIRYEGYGLGVAVDDLNADGWPDVYVANDFMTNDLVYINQQDGTFKESSSEVQRHQSFNGMGVDIADINNDLLPDIMVLDMLPDNNERRKSMMPGMNYQKFVMEQENGYVPQFMRNTLQINRGMDPQGTSHFSDISQLAGLHDTDWSWAPLMADFDNDGLKDVYITNGFVKDITDLDFINYKAAATTFGTKESKQQKKMELIDLLKSVRISNRIFKNQGGLSFREMSEEWGIQLPSFSNGAAFADLDNDGDLDLLVNNINDKAYLFENQARQLSPNSHFLEVKLEGGESNRLGTGAKIMLYANNKVQYSFQSPVKGYLSSMSGPTHFGLGNSKEVDSLKICWHDGKCQVFRHVKTDQVLTVKYADAVPGSGLTVPGPDTQVFHKANDRYHIHYKHQENLYIDFNNDPLLPRLYSRGGPGIAVGDADHKNGTDFFVGGAAGHPGTLFLQKGDGTFSEKAINEQDAGSEDMGALFLDADLDGDQDLYVVSGGSEFAPGAADYQDRLYVNDGKGNFSSNPALLPEMHSSGSCVVGADYDRDGDIDLFVGGRYQPNAYPTAPASFLLQNETYNFQNKTDEVAPGLSAIGMVSAAVWTDFDHDNWVDLIVVGEWMPVTFFRNEQGHLVNVTRQTGLNNTRGWWNSIQPADIDNDGDMDYIVGNMGTNIDYKPTPQQPIQVYASDYDHNGKLDPVLAHYLDNNEQEPQLFPFHGRDDLFKQLIMLKKKFRDYESYASATLPEVIPEEMLAESGHWKAETFETCLIENKGEGKFAMRPLPVEAQFSTVNGILAEDFNQDGNIDLMIGGNSCTNEIEYGWQDASLALYLTGDGKGNFTPVTAQQSGLFLNTDIKALSTLYDHQGNRVLLATANSDSLVALTLQGALEEQLVYANPMDAFAEIHYKDGRQRKLEFAYGSGYLSQSSRVIAVSDKVASVDIVDFSGNKRTLSF